MFPIRPLLVLSSCAALAFGGVSLAQDETDGAVDAEKIEEVVEERAEEESSDGEPEDADLGEASYNVSDCSPGVEDDELDVSAEGNGDGANGDEDEQEPGDAQSGSEEEGDMVADAGVDGKEAIEDCEPVVK